MRGPSADPFCSAACALGRRIVTSKRECSNAALNFLFYFVLLIPFCTALVNLILTGIRDKRVSKRLSIGFYVLLVLNILHVIGLTVLLFIFYNVSDALIALGIAFLLFYIGL